MFVAVAPSFTVRNALSAATVGALFELQPDPIVERVATRAFLNPAGAIPIRPGALDDATLIGAAELAFQPLLLDPRSVVGKQGAR